MFTAASSSFSNPIFRSGEDCRHFNFNSYPDISEQTKWEREAGIFASFLDAASDFAGEEIVDWKHNQNDSPDIVCIDRLGNRIGVEMTEWLHERQTRDFSRWERVLRDVNFPDDWTIDVYLDPFGRDWDTLDRVKLVAEVSHVINEEISRPKVWNSGLLSFAVAGAALVGRAPIAAKYCNVVAGHKPDSGRLLFQGGGAFSPDEAAVALHTVISKKAINKSYATIKRVLELRSLYLLIYYDLAILKNTPNLDVDVAGVAASALSAQPSAFDAAFVLMFPGGDTNSGRTVHRIVA